MNTHSYKSSDKGHSTYKKERHRREKKSNLLPALGPLKDFDKHQKQTYSNSNKDFCGTLLDALLTLCAPSNENALRLFLGSVVMTG
ncbi:unnamed protein product [Clavelina lepadiformis]|uniref:Uncharacterized protein n=1 Tax=Clavelina lepadiformis TaxID=159417 RepID=A0ABP0FMA8_CLALP